MRFFSLYLIASSTLLLPPIPILAGDALPRFQCQLSPMADEARCDARPSPCSVFTVEFLPASALPADFKTCPSCMLEVEPFKIPGNKKASVLVTASYAYGEPDVLVVRDYLRGEPAGNLTAAVSADTKFVRYLIGAAGATLVCRRAE